MAYLTNEQAIQSIETLIKRKFSAEQIAILSTKGGLSIAAVAGSGKTTVLTALIAKRILTGEIADPNKILCTTFSRTGAAEVENRLNAILDPLGVQRVKVATLHSTCYNILRHFGINVTILPDGENYKLISQAVAQAIGRKTYLESDMLEQIVSTIGIMENGLLTIDELFMSGKYLLDYDKKTFSDIVTTYKTLKRATGKFTYDDLLIGVYEWLCVAKSDVVLQYCRDNWHYLFIDEFQDTNKVQFEIIKAILNVDDTAENYFKDTWDGLTETDKQYCRQQWEQAHIGHLRPEDKLVVVGDDDQNVYEWRGTDPRIMINIRSVVDIRKMNLSTNYRCQEKIVNAAMNCVKNMGTRQDKTMQANMEGGKVEILDVTKQSISVDYRSPICKGSRLIADRVIHEIGSGEHGVVPEGHFCVMSRTNIEMCILANMLLRQGMIVNQSYGMMISKTQAWAALKKIVQLSKPFNGSYKLQGLLYQLVPYATNKMEELINDISNSCQCSIDYAIEYMIECWQHNPPVFAHLMIPSDEYKAKYAGRGRDSISPKTECAVQYALSKFDGHFQLVQLINAIRSEDSLKALLILWQTCLADKTSRMVLAIKEYLNSVYLETNRTEFEKYILMTEQVENNNNQAVVDKRLELRTIHGAKGLEWNVVFILNDDNYSFPDLNKILVLADKYNVKTSTLKDIIDSERRLHYVAQTRAKYELYCICDKSKASVFLEEAFGYDYTPPKDALDRARAANTVGLDENGRILDKAFNRAFGSTNISEENIF